MKKKSAIVLCVCFIFLMGLTGCTKLEPQDLYGNWTGNWEYEGRDIEVTLFFDADGNYTKTTTNDGEKKYELGKYTIEGSVVNKDIEDGVIAAGNPCKVIRKITEEDKQKYPMWID